MLSRAECTALRGLAILGIVLHNFCHWLPGIVHENEYNYNQANVDWFNHVVSYPDANLLLHICSFFGHYGVPIFLFLSAYGLVMKYENGTPPPPEQPRIVPLQPTRWTQALAWARPVWRFVRYQYLKLFRMMIIGLTLFLIIDNITPGGRHYRMIDLLGVVTMMGNLLPEPHHAIWPGPYWFFGLMVQLYLVYRLLLYKRHWGFALGLMAVCMVAQMVCKPGSDALNYLRYNFVGGMLPFGLGLLYARFGMAIQGRMYNQLFLAVSLALVYSYSDGFWSWLFVPLFVCSTGFTVVKTVPLCTLKPFVWMGQISAAMFVVHPILRKIFIPISRHGDVYTGLFIYLLTTLACAYLFNILLKNIPSPKY